MQKKIDLNNVELLVGIIMTFSLPLSEAIKNIAFGILFLCFCIQRIKKENLYLTPFAKGLLIFLSTAIFCSFFSMEKSLSFKNSWDIFRFSTIYLILINDFKEENKKRFIEWSLIIGTTLSTIWGIVVWKAIWQKTAFLEIASLGHFNSTGIFLSLILILIECKLFAIKNNKKISLLLLFCIIIITIALILTTNRGGLIGFIIASSICLSLIKTRKKAILILLIIIFVGTIVAFLNKDFREKFTSLASIKERLVIWKLAIKQFRSHPIFGSGNCFSKIDFNSHGIKKVSQAHNIFIHTACQMGIIGLIGLFCSIFGFIFTWFRTKENYRKYAAIGAFIILVFTGIFEANFIKEMAIAFVMISFLMDEDSKKEFKES